MKLIEKIRNSFQGLIDAFARYPLTAIFLLAATIVNAMSINSAKINYEKFIFAFVVGAFLSTVVQMVYERFFDKIVIRFILMAVASLLTLGYYMIIRYVPDLSMEIIIKTSVALFALFIAFIWVPVIRSEITFNESFMSGFKAFFISIFFSAIIFGGVSLILGAIDQLLFNVNNKFYPHTANIVFILFAPMYFLSFTPIYQGKKDEEYHSDILDKAVSCPKYLEILISYIIIPLAVVFTLILLIYIGMNIGGSFWTDELLEPILVSYTIIVILIYILASNLENKFVLLFRKIFPKILIPIVLFQTINSVLKIRDLGLTHGRYFVILFGVFAFIAGIIFSTMPVKKNGLIAAVLIVLAIISIIPPVDAFTISRVSQVNLLQSVLVENNMLEDNNIKINPIISEGDKQKIIQTITYLDRMKYTDEIPWLPEHFNIYEDFEETFGFTRYEWTKERGPVVYLRSKIDGVMNISAYDYFAHANVSNANNDLEDTSSMEFVKQGEKYSLITTFNETYYSVQLLDETKNALINFDSKEIFDKFENYYISEGEISLEEATFSRENDRAKITIITQNLNLSKRDDDFYYDSEIYIFIEIK